MKKILVVLSLMVSGSVFAQDLGFGDVNYFLKKGQFNLSLDGNRSVSRYKSETTSTEVTTSSSSDGYVFNSNYAYAFTDRFNMFLGLDYQYEMANSVTASTLEYYQDGLKSPRVGGNLRLINQSENLVNFDLGAIATAKVMDSKEGAAAGDTKKNGNAVAPASSLELNARIGRKWNEANEWQFTLGGVYHHDGKYIVKNATGGDSSKLDVDPSVDVYTKISYQYRPVKEFMMNVALQTTRVAGVKGRIRTSDTNTSTTTRVDHDFTFTAKYLILENFIAKFNFNQGFNPNYRSSVSGVNSTIKYRHEHMYGLGVDFLF